jgi:hypothetical protein
MLNHRSGTKYEDLAYIDSVTGKAVVRTDYDVESQVMPSKRMKGLVLGSAPNTVISIHNHPGSSVPSMSDLKAVYKYKQKYGVIACHNGTVFKYQVTGEYDTVFVEGLLDMIAQEIYNNGGGLEKLLDQLKDDGNVILEVFKP